MPKFVPRQRKHRVRAREELERSQNVTIPDSNTTEKIPRSKQEREEKKRLETKKLLAEKGGQVSGKKRKRLEKYIETKLRKEENQSLIRQLETANQAEKGKVDRKLYQSTKNLGRAGETKREALSRAAREYKAGIDVEKNQLRIFETPRQETEIEEYTSDEEEQEQQASVLKKNDTAPKIRVEPSKTNFGSGLKRPLEVGEDGKPIIKRRKKAKGVPISVHLHPQISEEAPWEGFSSEEEDGGVSLSREDGGSEDEELQSESGSKSGSDENQVESDDSLDESENESDEDESDDTSVEDDRVEKRARTSAFKAWATQQGNVAAGFTPSALPPEELSTIYQAPPKPANFTPRPAESDPLPPELQPTKIEREAHAIIVERSSSIQESRLALPVVAEEQKIMEAVHSNSVVIIWGATGSGKTTQVPQFLFEAGYGAKDGPTPGLIGVTQPRRVAAVSMAKRVAVEMGAQGDKVAYQIRFDTTVSDKTAIKFMTDGVLLREVAQDFALTKYSAIVIDEAHERSVNTDILIGLLSRIVDLRASMVKEDPTNEPLKLIIMSATLRIADFTENKRLFRTASPPLIQAEGRQYPVTTHFARRTNKDYLEETFRKVSRGHRKLPRGGMLVFLTGQNEITTLAKRLRQTFVSTDSSTNHAPVRIAATEASLETEDIDLGGEQADFEDDGSDDDETEIRGLDDDEENEFDIGEDPDDTVSKVHVLPLYSQLPTAQQMRVFEGPPDGSRAIILATNVAETSLTIPGIRYVFDCGRAKEKKYDEETGVQSFNISWISKASASQRAGRAGRTGPGHCYRLYSSAVYERDFEEHALPELLRTPIEGIVLQLKSMDLQHVVNFPFPTAPDRQSLARAEKMLGYLGALSNEGKITELGRQLSLYPLNPRFARMLVMGQGNNLTAQTIALVAALSIPEILVSENQLNLPPDTSTDPDKIRTNEDNLADIERHRILKNYRNAHADLARKGQNADCIKLHTALGGYLFAASSSESHAAEEFCGDNFLRLKALQEASQLRSQLSHIIRSQYPGSLPTIDDTLPLPTEKEKASLKLICAAGFIDQVAIRADFAPTLEGGLETQRKSKRAIDVPYLPLFPTKDTEAPFVYIHPSSLLSQSSTKSLPTYIVYSRLQKSAPSTIYPEKSVKIRMHPLTPLTTGELSLLARGTPLVRYSKPVVGSKVIELPRVRGVEMREVTVGTSLVPGGEGEGSEGMGWPLGESRIVERKQRGKGWVFEREV